jgi:hypothetical protein
VIEPSEREYGVTVIPALQPVVWRDGFGRLFRED